MKKKRSKRFNKLLESLKNKKGETIEEAIKKVKKTVQ
jgi:ribosomal protein L1